MYMTQIRKTPQQQAGYMINIQTKDFPKGAAPHWNQSITSMSATIMHAELKGAHTIRNIYSAKTFRWMRVPVLMSRRNPWIGVFSAKASQGYYILVYSQL